MPKSGNAKSILPKLNILVIDVDADIAEALSCAISLTNNKCHCFTNPTQAVEAYFQEPNKYNALFTDLRMPEMSGEEVIAKIRKVNKDIPIIIITATGGAFVSDDLVKLNIPTLIAKPFELSDIELAIKLIQESYISQTL